jgi:uncharacterized membrane protein
MAEIVVIGYPDEATAEKAWATLGQLQHDLIVDLADSAVVTRDLEGKIKVVTPTHATGAGAAGGAVWGGLIGLLFFIPVAGLVIGGLMGALAGKMSDMGIKDEVRSQVQEAVKPGTSALVVVYRKVTPDKAIDALKPYGGTVLKTSLSAEVEKQLQEALTPASV